MSARILIVDDNDANRLLARSTLEDEGYEVTVAASGEEAIASFERDRPDCILLDVRMPGMDGFAVCERIRALPGGAETPVLFFTALRDVDTFDQALRAGGDDFLTKPVRPTELIVRVQSALKLRRLGEELREHYEILRRQRDDLMRLQLQKERLTAFLVHDLKNPVGSMDLNAQLLLRHKDLPGSAREAAERIRSDARQLTGMLLNLLDLAKADEGQLAPRRSTFQLRGIVDQVFAENAASAEGRKVSLRAALDIEEVEADEELFRRMLTNLVENAIRHAPPDTSVTVGAASRDAATELRVADAGKGIPPDMREKIFDPFVQAGSGDRVSRQGRGLGLAFCRMVVEAHGGRIWVEDASPGAAFYLRLPRGS